jgi:O-antigen ligase
MLPPELKVIILRWFSRLACLGSESRIGEPPDHADSARSHPEAGGDHRRWLPTETVELCDGTVGENIARFDPSATPDSIVRAAEKVGIHDMIAGLPDGYNFKVGENGLRLSAAQRQHLGLARAVFGTTSTVASGLSVSPAATWAAACSLIPFFALFFGVSGLNERRRLKLARLLIALTAVGVIVGFIQLSEGADSALRFYAITNDSEPVGFFANRNHFAAQLYVGLVFTAIWLGFSGHTFTRARKSDSPIVFRFMTTASLVIAALSAIAIAQSRAGFILALAALGGTAAIFVTERRGRGFRFGSISATGKLVFGGLILGAVFATQFGVNRILTRFENNPIDDLRIKLSSSTMALAVESLPLGIGLGTFPEAYAATEKTEDLFNEYINRAHNDWAELFLEAGLPGAVAAGLFLIWFGWRTWQIWRQRPSGPRDHHLTLQRAATLAIALLLAHSFVDYPLRTTAIAATFAFACAIMISPPRTHPE